MNEKIQTKIILEMLGAPKEYIEQTMKDYVTKIKQEGVQVKKEKYEEAQPAERLFSTFAELDIDFKNLKDLLDFCFEALPSSVEVITPIEMQINARDLTGFLNDLQARLHETDMIVKTSRAHNKILESNTTAVFHNFITFALKQEPKTIEELAQTTGVTTKEIKPFLNKLVENNKIKLEGTKYQVN